MRTVVVQNLSTEPQGAAGPRVAEPAQNGVQSRLQRSYTVIYGDSDGRSTLEFTPHCAISLQILTDLRNYSV